MLLPCRRQAHHLGQGPLPRPATAARRLLLALAPARRLLLVVHHAGTPELLLLALAGTPLDSPDLLTTAWVCTPSWFIAESSLCYERHRQELSG